MSQVEHAATDFRTFDVLALALCGLAVLSDGSGLDEAANAFRAARSVTAAAGVVKDVVDLFDSLSLADSTGVLASTRDAADEHATG
jgi:hypothetical protein